MTTRKIRSKVVGVTFKNPDRSNRQTLIRKHCRPGSALILISEPHNPHSDSAIGVWVATGANTPPAQIGYVRDGLAGELTDVLEEGGSISARVLEVTGGGRGESLGVNYEIVAHGSFDGRNVASYDEPDDVEVSKGVGKEKGGCGCGGCLVAILCLVAVAVVLAVVLQGK